MSTVWKALLGLALVVPLGAYVAGSLAASASEDPAPRQTIVIDESGPSPTTSGNPTQRPSVKPSESSESPDDDEVEVITPGYDDFDEDDDHGDDDNRGRGGGGDDDDSGDDDSGPGGGDD